MTAIDLASDGYSDAGLGDHSAPALGDGSALALTLAIMDEPELNIGQHDRFDTLSQPLQIVDGGGYDVYVAPLPILDDTAMLNS